MSERKGDRCRGPFRDKSKPEDGKQKPFFLLFHEDGKPLRKQSFVTEQEAQVVLDEFSATTEAAQAINIEQGIDLYIETYLKTVKQNRAGSVYATVYLLKMFLGPILKCPLASWTETQSQLLRKGKCKMVPGEAKPVWLVHGLMTRELPRTKKPAAHTTQLNALAAAQAFAAWLLREGLLKVNPMAWFNPLFEAPAAHGSKGQTKLSFSQAEKVLFLSLEIATRESGKTDIGTEAAATFLMMMTALRATTMANLNVSNLDIRKGAAHGDMWILTAPQAKKRGAIKMVPYALPEEFEPVLGPLCIGRQPEGPMFLATLPMSPKLKAELAAAYSALDQRKTAEATKIRQDFLKERGMTRQQVNKWQRGDFSSSEREERRHKRDWFRRAVAKICDLAGVPRETAHALRGALTNKLTAAGYADVAQWLLLHKRGSTTDQSYTSPMAKGLGKTNQFMGIVGRGKTGK